MAPRSKPVKAPSNSITATSQQSRFHTETLDTSLEIDLKDVTVSIGERDLIVDSHLRLKDGVRYGLVGRNGSGKSTLLTAIADKLIPGLSPSMRILLLSQVEDSSHTIEQSTISNTALTALQHVVRGDNERLTAIEELDALTSAVESASLVQMQKVVCTIRLSRARTELQEARKVSLRRSGARGKEARAEDIKAEEKVKRAEALLDRTSGNPVDIEIAEQAVEMLQEAQNQVHVLETATTESRAATILSGLGLSRHMMASPYVSLSGGWRSRCSLATALLVRSDLLLLDEPSNFLDLEAIIWLERFLSADTTRTLVLVSHDRNFLDNVVEETIALRNKKLTYFEGNPSAYEVNERKERRRLLGMKEALEKKREHVEKSIQAGIASAKKTGDENRQRMVKSRQKKLDERWGVETSAKGTRFKLNRDMAGYHTGNRAEIAIEDTEPRVRISIPNPAKLRTLGDLVHFEGVAYKIPNTTKFLLENVTFTIEQGGRCAFVGANGQGKSTLAKLIMGYLTPSRGTIVRHPLLKTGYFSQHSVEDLTASRSLSLTDTPVTALSYFLGYFEEKGEKVVEQDARSCLGSFGLQGKTASDTPLSQLSGGQKVRLALALLVFRPPSLLLLDEITTHVDFPTIQALAAALRSFTGAIICITHDRWFSRVCIEGESPRIPSPDDGESEEDLDTEEEELRATRGRTYRVDKGKVQLLEKGMDQYVALVERKLKTK